MSVRQLSRFDSDGTVVGQGATDKVGFHGAAPTVQGTAIADLVHAVGTADGTVDDVGGAFSQATLNDNFKELSAKINAIAALLRAKGLIA